jgi:hypothetical protein
MKIRPMGAMREGGRTLRNEQSLFVILRTRLTTGWYLANRSFGVPQSSVTKFVTGQLSFQGFNLVCSFKVYVLAIRVSLPLVGGRWFLWEDARYLPRPAFCSLTVSLWCTRILGAWCKEFSYRRTSLILINWDVETSVCAENPDN